MIQFNGQNNIKQIHYNGQNIKAVYDYQGKVWPPSNADGKLELTLNDGTVVKLPCDGTSGITSAETSAYSASMVSAIIGGCVEALGGNAFRWCRSLSSVTIQEGLKLIGTSNFNEVACTTITIPSTVTYIGRTSFTNNTELEYITCLATTPPRTDTDNFRINPSLKAVYVPAASVDAYKKSGAWRNVRDKIYPIP